MRNTLESPGRYETAGAGPQLSLPLLATPLVLVLSVSLTLLMVLFPPAALLAASAPLMLLMTTRTMRPLLIACLVGNLLMLFGSSGEVEFLGRLQIDSSTTASAITFSNSMAIAIYSASKSNARRESLRGAVLLPIPFHVGLLSAAVVVLLVRFSGGIPILQGDVGRLSGLLSINPYLGLLSGILPIAAVFLKSPKSHLVFVLKMLLLVLVVGTASRLLLGAVIVGIVSSSGLLTGRLKGKSRFYLLSAGVITIFAVTKIYAARTAEGIQQIYESRLSSIGGVTGWISDIIGPSIFYAARNGLVVSEIIHDNSLQPPQGFVFGGLMHVLNLNVDPEIWLTSAIGFNVSSVGAIATPLWSGAQADFGVPGAYFFAVAVGLVLATALRRVPHLEYWFAFGILLSFYGSYMVSSQFLGASLIVVLVVMWNKSRSTEIHAGIR